MFVHRAYGLLHAIELGHVNRDRQTVWKLLCQFFQRIGAASEQGDSRARSDRAIAVDKPIPDEAPVTMKTRSLICIVAFSLA